jgi:hypothetical protein
VWAAVEQIAARQEMSPLRLAIVSGLDSTTFNKSKRRSGEYRWPSMESVAKVLMTAHMTFTGFGALVDEKMGR